MIDQSEFRWLRRHTLAAPFGIFAVTMALAWWEQALPWPRVGPSAAADLVDLAAIIYGMLAVLFERGVRLMFWALDQRRQWRERWRQEALSEGVAIGRAEGQAEGRATGLAEGRAEGQAEGRAETRAAMKTHLERVAREKGIDLDELLPRDKE